MAEEPKTKTLTVVTDVTWEMAGGGRVLAIHKTQIKLPADTEVTELTAGSLVLRPGGPRPDRSD